MRIPGENLVLCSMNCGGITCHYLGVVSKLGFGFSWFCVGFFFTLFSSLLLQKKLFFLLFYSVLFMIGLGTFGLTIFVVIPLCMTPLTVMSLLCFETAAGFVFLTFVYDKLPLDFSRLQEHCLEGLCICCSSQRKTS